MMRYIVQSSALFFSPKEENEDKKRPGFHVMQHACEMKYKMKLT